MLSSFVGCEMAFEASAGISGSGTDKIGWDSQVLNLQGSVFHHQLRQSFSVLYFLSNIFVGESN